MISQCKYFQQETLSDIIKVIPPSAGAPGRGSIPPSPCYSSEDVISCQLTRSVQCAHQKPITVLRAAAGRVVTGSQDHTVRVTHPVPIRPTSCLKFSAEFARKRAVRSSITIFRNEKQLLKMPTLRAPLLVFF